MNVLPETFVQNYCEFGPAVCGLKIFLSKHWWPIDQEAILFDTLHRVKHSQKIFLCKIPIPN